MFEEELKTGLYSIVKCPCCNSDTLNFFYICPKCKWEYDGVLRDDEYSIVNGSTLGNYRKNMYLMQENAYE